jgi:hypothetical protein
VIHFAGCVDTLRPGASQSGRRDGYPCLVWAVPEMALLIVNWDAGPATLVPPAVLTVTSTGPAGAFAGMSNIAVNCVGVEVVLEMPILLPALIVPPFRLAPVMVTIRDVSGAALFGPINATVGVGGEGADTGDLSP